MSQLLDYLFKNSVDFTIGTYIIIFAIFTALIGGLIVSIWQHANQLHRFETENKALKQEIAKLENDIYYLEKSRINSTKDTES